jgi:hypothetical protein
MSENVNFIAFFLSLCVNFFILFLFLNSALLPLSRAGNFYKKKVKSYCKLTCTIAYQTAVTKRIKDSLIKNRFSL